MQFLLYKGFHFLKKFNPFFFLSGMENVGRDCKPGCGLHQAGWCGARGGGFPLLTQYSRTGRKLRRMPGRWRLVGGLRAVAIQDASFLRFRIILLNMYFEYFFRACFYNILEQ